MTAQPTTSKSRRSRASYTARIIAHTKPHPGGSVIDTKLLAVTDLDQAGSRSVTNTIAEVLEELAESYGRDLPPVIIYRDSSGRWDGIRHDRGTFRGFYPIGETDLARAIDKVVGLAAPSTARDRCEPK